MAPAPVPIRIARPVSDLRRSETMYCRGLGLRLLGRFENHAGFDGVILGFPGAHYHFEFTVCRSHPIVPAPNVEDLLVLYLPLHDEWRAACTRMLAAGFAPVRAFNPYWERNGRTFEDADRYRVVLECDRAPSFECRE